MAVLAPISGMPQFRNGKLVADAVAYFYDAGTTTDRTVYEQASGSAHEQPVEVTGAGNFPAVYIQGSNPYKIRIEDGDGALIIEYDDLQGETETVDSGGGGGTTIPTGAIMPMYTTGIVSGWVRMNGRTVGSATSGATERANADTEALFLHLWAVDTNLAVSGGRGGSAAADWGANKTIALPSARGRDLRGLTDMGNSDTGGLVGGTFSFGNGTTLGSYGGTSVHTLIEAEMPAHDHGGATGGPSVSSYPDIFSALGGDGVGNNYWFGNDADNHTHTIASDGGGTAHNNLPPFLLMSIYIKL
jgi:microcystin-dependent protein